MKPQENEIDAADGMIRLLTDFKKGKKIQFRKRGTLKWLNMTAAAFDFAHYEYRSIDDTVYCCVGFNLSPELKSKLDEIVASRNTNINSLFKADVEKMVVTFLMQNEPGLFQEVHA